MRLMYLSQDKKLSKPLGYHDLLQAFSESGCPVCRLEARTVDQAIDTILWELVNDPQTRHQLNAARGYCQTHAQQMVRNGAALGVSILMRDVLHTVSEILSASTFQSYAGLSVRQKLPVFNHRPNLATASLVHDLAPQTRCPLCTIQHDAGTRHLQTLVEYFDTDALLNAYRTSDGLCLPHFRQALTFVANEDTFNALTTAQLQIWQRLIHQLDEFIRKNDYRFQHEKMDQEKDAWMRTLAAISGNV